MARARTTNGFAQLLDTARVIVCCGSGGVGKTTTAAAMAVEASRRGRRVVLVTIDPAKRLADALGLDHLGNEPSEVRLADGGTIWATMLDARATFDDVIRRNARDESQVRAILSNPFYENVASRLSGSQEYMAAEKLYELHSDERFDLVVVDTPPTREALDFLDAPQRLMNFLDHRVYRWMVAPTRGGLKLLNFAAQPVLRTIGRVIGADVLADAIEFFRAFDGIEAGFRARAESVRALLRSGDTRYVVVTSARSDAVAEAGYFADTLSASRLSIAGLVVNRLQPQFGSGTAAAAQNEADRAEAEGRNDDAVLWRNLSHLKRIAEAETATLKPLLAKIAPAPVARVSQRPTDVHDLDAVNLIAADLVTPVDGTTR